MSNANSSKQVLLSTIAIAIIVVLVVGITFAFFNYTRTGSANNLNVGRIAFNSQETGNAINLTNVFPIDTTNGIPNDAANVGTVTINITGDTTYSDGVEYLVTAEDVHVETTTGKKVPLSLKVDVTNNLGTEDTDNDQIEYYTDREDKDTNYYKVLSEGVLYDGQYLLVGYIAPEQNAINGNVVIRAYIDEAKVGISDTYPEGTVRTVKTTNYSSSDCETTLTGVDNASTYCATATTLQEAIDNEDLTDAQISLLVGLGIVEEYINGTPASFGTGKVVLTTSEWNSLSTQGNGLSFKVRVEANEGIWLDPAIPTNAVGSIPSELKNNITEIYFIKETPLRMQRRYEAATVKADMTDTTLNEGKVLGWQEGNKLYIASSGKTYFPSNSTAYFAYLSNITKIEFENTDDSRVQNMTAMFFGLSSLEEIDLSNFNMSNVTNTNAVFGNSGFTSIDLSNKGNNNMQIGSSAFAGCSDLGKINMSGFNFGTSDLTGMFGATGLSNLEVVDLTNVNMSGVTAIGGLFDGRTTLKTIYVSNTWNIDSVPVSENDDKVFRNCFSLVGGNGTHYDSSHADREYARIDGLNNLDGYLTLKNN